MTNSCTTLLNVIEAEIIPEVLSLVTFTLETHDQIHISVSPEYLYVYLYSHIFTSYLFVFSLRETNYFLSISYVFPKLIHKNNESVPIIIWCYVSILVLDGCIQCQMSKL